MWTLHFRYEVFSFQRLFWTHRKVPFMEITFKVLHKNPPLQRSFSHVFLNFVLTFDHTIEFKIRVCRLLHIFFSFHRANQNGYGNHVSTIASTTRHGGKSTSAMMPRNPFQYSLSVFWGKRKWLLDYRESSNSRLKMAKCYGGGRTQTVRRAHGWILGSLKRHVQQKSF